MLREPAKPLKPSDGCFGIAGKQKFERESPLCLQSFFRRCRFSEGPAGDLNALLIQVRIARRVGLLGNPGQSLNHARGIIAPKSGCKDQQIDCNRSAAQYVVPRRGAV
ncbi:MAG: hypothetical protein O7B26_09845 [Planctomycetota bacterium]|nr:hypothetical protein [Planctomycetota bacterium]